MEKPIHVRFAEFKDRNHLSNQKIREIAYNYAISVSESARTFFTTQCSISEHVFYKVLEYAIICKLVDKEIQDRIFLKLASNGCRRGGKDALKASKDKKDRILQLQAQYSLFLEEHIASFSEIDLFQICKEYGRDKMSVSEIAKRHGTSIRVIEVLLNKGLGVLFDTYFAAKNRLEK